MGLTQLIEKLLINDHDWNLENYDLVDVFVYRSSSMRAVYGWRQGIRKGEKRQLRSNYLDSTIFGSKTKIHVYLGYTLSRSKKEPEILCLQKIIYRQLAAPASRDELLR